MTIKQLMPLDRAFHDRSGQIYNTMAQRFRERRGAKGRILQVGRELPFKLHHFRDWLEEQLGGKADGIVQCPYCPAFIHAMILRVDHCIPVSRGGELGLSNLAICCATCNTEKGQLTSEEYRNLLTLLNNGLLSREAVAEVRKRLRGSLLTFRGKPQKKGQAFTNTPAPSALFDQEVF